MKPPRSGTGTGGFQRAWPTHALGRSTGAMPSCCPKDTKALLAPVPKAAVIEHKLSSEPVCCQITVSFSRKALPWYLASVRLIHHNQTCARLRPFLPTTLKRALNKTETLSILVVSALHHQTFLKMPSFGRFYPAATTSNEPAALALLTHTPCPARSAQITAFLPDLPQTRTGCHGSPWVTIWEVSGPARSEPAEPAAESSAGARAPALLHSHSACFTCWAGC